MEAVVTILGRYGRSGEGIDAVPEVKFVAEFLKKSVFPALSARFPSEI